MPLAAALGLSAGACGGPLSQIVEDRWEIAPASGAPDISEIIDLGGSDVPLRGQLRLEGSDGVATIGETLWVRGRSFGRQPSVSVGGRPAAVLGRTRDGGALVRVPPATPIGPQPVVVSNELGKGEKAVPVRRYAAMISGGGGQGGSRVAWIELGVAGPIAAGVTASQGAALLAMSPDGRAAYLADPRRSTVEVLEIPAAQRPRSVHKVELADAPPAPGVGNRAHPANPIGALSAAARAPMLAVVRADDVVLLDLTSPLSPARSMPRSLPKAVRDAGLVASEISPDGKLLAAITGQGNRLLVLDLVPRGQAPLVAELALAPDVRVGILIDVAFSPDGQTLWVISGDTPASRPSGPQPTQLYAVRLRGSARAQVELDLARTVRIPDAVEPSRLSTGRALPLASGAAIRLPPERAPVFLSAREPSTAAGAASAAIFRVEADDQATRAAGAPGAAGRVDLSPDGRWLLAPITGIDGSGQVVAAPADGRPGPTRSIEVLPAAGGPRPAAARPPELRIQP